MSTEIPETSRQLMDAFGSFRGLHRHYSPVEGIRPSEFYVLVAVKKTQDSGKPGMRVSDLARRLDVATPTATQFVKRLEAAGYVKRQKSETDGRTVHVVMTEEGRSVLGASMQKLHGSFDGLVRHLGNKDSLLLADLLKKTTTYFRGLHDQ